MAAKIIISQISRFHKADSRCFLNTTVILNVYLNIIRVYIIRKLTEQVTIR